VSMSGRPNSFLRLIAWVMVLLAGASTLTILLSGIPLVGYDAYFHLNNLSQFISIRNTGIVIPRWTPNSYFGFGSATFYFYPSLTYVLGAIFFAISNSLPWSLRFLSIAVMVGMVYSCRLYLITLGLKGRKVWLASIFYAVGPYAFYDVIIRSNYAEYLSLIWVPIIFASIERILISEEWGERMKSIALCSIGFSLLGLTSIPMSVLIAFSLPFYIAVRIRGRAVWQFIPIVLALMLSIVCIAVYLFPIFHFQEAAHLAFVSEYGQNQWFRTSFIGNLSRGIHITDSSLALMMVLLSVTLCYMWLSRWLADRDPLSLGWTLLLAFVIVFQIPFIAGPTVHWMPFVGLIQFPSRFYVLVMLSLAVWLASARNPSDSNSARILVSTASLSVPVLGCIFFVVHPIRSLSEFPIEQKAQWSAFEYAPIQTSNDAARVIGYTKEHQSDLEIAPCIMLPIGDTLRTIEANPKRSIYFIVLRDSLSVRFHRFYWPEWRLSTSLGREIIPSYDSNGVLTASLPSGRYSLTLEMIESNAEQYGRMVSIFGVGILVICYLSGTVIDARRKRFNRVFSDM
jgi:hypothetical protein